MSIASAFQVVLSSERLELPISYAGANEGEDGGKNDMQGSAPFALARYGKCA